LPPTGGLDADRIEASPHVQTAHFRRLAQEISVVGVKLSGPLKNTCTPADSSAGTPAHGARKQRLDVPRSAAMLEGKALRIPPSPQGFAAASNHPTRSLPVSSLKYGSRHRIAQDRQPRDASAGWAASRYRSARSVSGTLTFAQPPTSAAHMREFTTTSARTSPARRDTANPPRAHGSP